MKLDCMGEGCPYPVMKAVAAMKKAKPGEVIELFTDHAPALETVPIQARRMGFTARIDEVGPAEWRITLARAE